MSNWKNEAEAREQIKALVADYYHDFKEKKEPYKDGDPASVMLPAFSTKKKCRLLQMQLLISG